MVITVYWRGFRKIAAFLNQDIFDMAKKCLERIDEYKVKIIELK